MTPDFAEHLLDVPEAERNGRVFKLTSKTGGTPGRWSMCRAVAAIGERAGVVTDPGKGLHATAHDLRRSFGTRWAKRVMPATLQLLMRHASINTTMAFYVGIEADDVAADLWAKHQKTAQEGTIQGTIGQNATQKGPTPI